jgi:hypothetical protein
MENLHRSFEVVEMKGYYGGRHTVIKPGGGLNTLLWIRPCGGEKMRAIKTILVLSAVLVLAIAPMVYARAGGGGGHGGGGHSGGHMSGGSIGGGHISSGRYYGGGSRFSSRGFAPRGYWGRPGFYRGWPYHYPYYW